MPDSTPEPATIQMIHHALLDLLEAVDRQSEDMTRLLNRIEVVVNLLRVGEED